MDNYDAIAEGAAEGVCGWLRSHPFSAQEPFFHAVSKAVKSWMDDHEEEILEAIAREVR